MPKVRVKNVAEGIYADGDRYVHPGEVVEVSDEHAEHLCAGDTAGRFERVNAQGQTASEAAEAKRLADEQAAAKRAEKEAAEAAAAEEKRVAAEKAAAEKAAKDAEAKRVADEKKAAAAEGQK